MLRSCDIENCEHTSATMMEKGEIYKKGRTYYVAGAPNDVCFKNSTHTLGVSIHSCPKDVAVWPKWTRFDCLHLGDSAL